MAIPRLFDDRFGGLNGLANLLVSRSCIIIEIGEMDGLVWVEDVQPGGYGIAHIVVFNRRRIKDLGGLMRRGIQWLFRVTNLAYLAAWIPEFNRGAYRVCTESGFTYDGLARGMLVYSGERVGAQMFSLSRDEALDGQFAEDPDVEATDGFSRSPSEPF